MRIFRLPILTTLIALTAVAIAAMPSLATFLQFDRTLVLHGEVWRLLTCHLTHWSTDHLAWDVLTFVLLGVMAETAGPRRFAVCLFLSSLVIPVAVTFAKPELAVYRGLSGIDSALFALVLADWFLRGGPNRVVAIVAGIALASKIAFESFTGQTLFVDAAASGFVPVSAAHAAGAVAGLIAAPFGRRFFRRSVNVYNASPTSRLSGMRSGRAFVTSAVAPLNSNLRCSS